MTATYVTLSTFRFSYFNHFVRMLNKYSTSFDRKVFKLSALHEKVLCDSHSLYLLVPLNNHYGLVFVMEMYSVLCEVVTKLSHG